MKHDDTNIPRAVLSQAFADRMGDRRLVSAIFTTFKFDPGFFEQQILPVFLDIPLNAATAIRWQQLEDRIRELSGHVAVYYDQNGLEPGDDGSARLDVRRIPVRLSKGAIFHTKNVFLLIEDETPNDEGKRRRALLVACMSANLTKAGWWENVEACHIEEIHENGPTWLKEDLLDFLKRLHKLCRANVSQRALDDIKSFLERDQITQRKRQTGDPLPTRFYHNQGSIADFLYEVARERIRGLHLEIISPYFDRKGESPPLAELQTKLEPLDICVYLPRGREGEARCDETFYKHVRAIPDVSWSRLPGDLLRSGNAVDAKPRFVHAKVYRFFQSRPKREILFIGSANLTNAAHQGGRNFESGFLVEIEPKRPPEPWMTPEDKRPKNFVSLGDGDDDGNTSVSSGTCLRLRFHWDTKLAEVYWDDNKLSPHLEVKAQGELVFIVESLRPMEWTALPSAVSERMEIILRGASLFQVCGEGDVPAALLVQEEGMWKRPSILQDLSIADILHSWALLTPEQRAAFVEARGQYLVDSAEVAHLIQKTRITNEGTSIFDQFAGIFHAFGCLERNVRDALGRSEKPDSREKNADNRQAKALLFGEKYDALAPLLRRLVKKSDGHDAVDRYVIVLCARQVCRETAKVFPRFWGEHETETRLLDQLLAQASNVRDEILERNSAEMAPFLDWFDTWFLRRAKSQEEDQAE